MLANTGCSSVRASPKARTPATDPFSISDRIREHDDRPAGRLSNREIADERFTRRHHLLHVGLGDCLPKAIQRRERRGFHDASGVGEDDVEDDPMIFDDRCEQPPTLRAVE